MYTEAEEKNKVGIIEKLSSRNLATDIEHKPAMGRQYLREMGIPEGEIESEFADFVATLKGGRVK